MIDSWDKITANGLWPPSAAAGEMSDAPPLEEEIVFCREWIRKHVRPSAHINRRSSSSGGVGTSYRLKHLVEAWSRETGPHAQTDHEGREWIGAYRYVSNGSFIEAANRERYRFERVSAGSLNAFFNMAWLVSPRVSAAQRKREEKAAAREGLRVVRADFRAEFKAKPGSSIPECAGIYFVQTSASAEGPIKIGQAQNIRDRVRNIQTSHPWPLKLLAYIEIADEVARDETEAEMHARFFATRMHGEWFSPDAELLTFIAEKATSK